MENVDSNSNSSSELDSGIIGSIVGEADVGNLECSPFRRSDSSLSQTKSLDEKKDVKCKKTVLLTFAQDGYELAKEVARRIRNLNIGIGVVILEENSDELDYCCDNIYRWFLEVASLKQALMFVLFKFFCCVRLTTSYQSSRKSTCGKSARETTMSTTTSIAHNPLASTPGTRDSST